MPSQVTNYKCPACTGPLHFESSTGRMECEYCGSTFSVNEIEALYEAKDEQASAAFAGSAAAQSAADDEHFADGMDADWDLSGAGSSWGAEGEDLRAAGAPREKAFGPTAARSAARS